MAGINIGVISGVINNNVREIMANGNGESSGIKMAAMNESCES